MNEGPWKLISEIPEETEPTEPETEPTTEPTEPETEPTEETQPGDVFEVNGSADYDLDLIREVLFVPNGVDSAYLEENYVLTGYINDVNTQYTQTLVEYGVSGAYDSVYEYGVQRTTMYQNGQVYSYEYDGRGSVSELVNSLGKTQIKYSYGAYGETISTTIGWNNPVTNPYRYNAERIDDVAGVPAFQYLRARYLNPYTSSFLSQDSYLGNLLTPLSQNRYAYAHNNPVMYTDPSGHIGVSALMPTLFYLDKNLKENNTLELANEGSYRFATSGSYLDKQAENAKWTSIIKICLEEDITLQHASVKYFAQQWDDLGNYSWTTWDIIVWKTFGGSDFLFNKKSEYVSHYNAVIRDAAEQYDIPEFLLAGIAYSEFGGDPMWIDDIAYSVRAFDWCGPDWVDQHLTITKRPELTSFGNTSIQVRRAADMLGYNSYVGKEADRVIDSLKNPIEGIYLSAMHLSEL